jgi:hypothetical protein
MKPRDPALVKALVESGFADHTAGRLTTAEVAYRRALAIEPHHPDARYNLALVLQGTHRHAEAEEHYRAGLDIKPGNARAWNNLGNLLRDTRRWAEAGMAFERALALQPDHPTARMNLALTLLSDGRYEQAWPLYETRLVTHKNILPALACPRWQGESLTGKRLLLVCEQGFGDAVQFIRYAPLLKDRGAACISVLCRAPLAPLLATCSGVDAVVSADDGSHDLHVPLLSLPMHFGTTLADIPAHQPYLRADPGRIAHWQARLPCGSPRVGLGWRGNAGHANDASRSLALTMLEPLWRTPGVSFVSLQKGAGEEEAARTPARQPLFPAGAQVNDFADLAALVHLMDVVICVDTALAHVAGAIGKPCWVLLPAMGCDWRWFGGADPSQAPWYPRQMRLFHQPAAGRWEPLLNALPAALHASLTSDPLP